MSSRNVFDNISSLDYRYWDKEAAAYLSEEAFVRYKLMVELALVKVLHKRGLCSEEIVAEVEEACQKVTTQEVYDEEGRIHHDIRALVNKIREKVSDAAKPYVHMTATSYDIVDTANAARYRHALEKVLIPHLLKLEEVLIKLALRESKTIQIGRTHGQHAVPITFGFAIAEYVSRLGNCILSLQSLTGQIKGKFSGAVGAHNAPSLFFDDPLEFERQVLIQLAVWPAEYSTQIVPPEELTRVFFEVVLAIGIMANLADDMRNLQRTEIGEVGEEFGDEQVGSSTMPQKRNPINFENSKSCWKIVSPRTMTMLMDQICEHQRDLTNSASSRSYGEVIAYAVSVTKRMIRIMSKLKVDHSNMKFNLEMTEGLILAEPLYIMLAAYGHPDAHEKVRQLTIEAMRSDTSIELLALDDPELQPYIEKMTKKQRNILSDPALYTGIAAEKAEGLAKGWAKRFAISIESKDPS